MDTQWIHSQELNLILKNKKLSSNNPLRTRTRTASIGKNLWRFSSSIQLLNLLVILLCSSLLPNAMSTAKSSPESGLLRVETTLNHNNIKNDFQIPTTTTIPTISRPIPTMPSSSGSGTGTGSTPINTGTVTPLPKQDKIGSIYLDNDDFAHHDRLQDEQHAVNDRLSLTKHRIPGGNGLLFNDDSASSDAHDDLRNDTRERDALQEEGSHHQPVVFIGGPGYIPPNNLRPRPVLEAEIPWSNRPVLDNAPRYPYPLQSAWDRNYRNPFNMTRVHHIEAECQDDFMKLKVSFNGSFQGLIYSSGFAYDNDCVYVNGTGRDYYEYLIRLNRCGTLGASNHAEGRNKEPSKNFMWNTVTVQYNPMIEEEWDEHFKVTCEYGYDFWKTVTFKPFDVEVATGNPVVFTLTPPEAYMEVRYGFGASGTRVGGPVRVGDPLTLMIYMRSQYDGFDLVVNDCYAHNGGTKRIQLIDHYGCPVDSKLMSPFRGTWSHTNVYETQVYAYLKTFRFTGSPALYIECDVRMCHGQCPSQPCYWRNVKNIQKRSVEDPETNSTMDESINLARGRNIHKRSVDNLDPEKNSTLSESINLSQALTVLQDKDDGLSLSSTEVPSDSVCFKTSVFTALFGLGVILLATLGMVSMITCFRLKRIKHVNDGGDSSDILRPYSHHINSGSHITNLPHHWSSSNSSSSSILSKPRVP